jgi:hypothetical protein
MIAYQLYSSRNFPPLDATAKMLASVGLTCTEGFGGLYDTPATLAATAAALVQRAACIEIRCAARP